MCCGTAFPLPFYVEILSFSVKVVVLNTYLYILLRPGAVGISIISILDSGPVSDMDNNKMMMNHQSLIRRIFVDKSEKML
jgi:hypothetical protein